MGPQGASGLIIPDALPRRNHTAGVQQAHGIATDQANGALIKRRKSRGNRSWGARSARVHAEARRLQPARNKGSGGGGSNSQHSAWKADTLPIELPPRVPAN